jgi:hypothetical protein
MDTNHILDNWICNGNTDRKKHEQIHLAVFQLGFQKGGGSEKGHFQILMFLSPLPHVPLPFTKTNNDLKRMQLTSLE